MCVWWVYCVSQVMFVCRCRQVCTHIMEEAIAAEVLQMLAHIVFHILPHCLSHLLITAFRGRCHHHQSRQSITQSCV